MEVKRLSVAISYAPAYPARTIIRIVCAGPESAARLSERLAVIPDRPDLGPEHVVIVKQELRT
jgi:hypothetical protein